ncbi:MAG: response regulator transcription factor [Chthoniobacterales bacterium]|nr:response regulator transcription factor [Chthoniobacterales bacterium]
MDRPSTEREKTGELHCVVVEDQGLFLEILGAVLNMHGGLRVVGTARSVAEGKACCAKHRPDLLVLDLVLADGSGLDVAELLLQVNPDARVIIVSGKAAEFVCPRWLDKSLQAVVSKNDTFTALRVQIEDVLGAARPSVVRRGEKIFAHKPLTSREGEIFALMGEGLSSKEIGQRLHISEHTVHEHRKRLAVKLGTTGNELARRAIEQRQTFPAQG